MIEQGVYNANGEVAMKHAQPNTQFVNVSGREYVFFPKRNVSMCWVREEDVQKILDITRQCCGGNKAHPYRLAHGGDVRVWENLAER